MVNFILARLLQMQMNLVQFDNRADYVELNLNDENLRNKITKLVKKKTYFPDVIFVTVDHTIIIMLLNMLEKD